MKILKTVLILVFIASSGIVSSQEIMVTLKDAIGHAYKNDPNIVKLENSIDIQEGNIRTSYGKLFPDLKFNSSWQRSNVVVDGGYINQEGIPVIASNQTTNNFVLQLRSDVTIFDGLVNFDQVDLAKQTQTQYRIQLRKLKQDIAVKIMADYIAVLKNKQIVVINEATLADSRAQLDKIRIFVEVGRRTQLDILNQDVIVAQNELAVEQAKKHPK
jgi:outer membrane protein